jgi:DNA-binding LytR/AlgR family response regulator
VVAFQADGDVVIVHSRLGRYLSDLSLSTLIDRLPGSEFRRIHRSTIINTNHIRTILPLSSRRWMLRMSNGLEVIVSKRMAAQVREMAGW